MALHTGNAILAAPGVDGPVVPPAPDKAQSAPVVPFVAYLINDMDCPTTAPDDAVGVIQPTPGPLTGVPLP